MLQLIQFILATAGLTMILVKGKIFKPLREYISERIEIYKIGLNKFPTLIDQYYFRMKLFTFLNELFTCSMCMGIYASFPIFICVYKSIYLNLLYYIFIGSICSYMVVTYSEYLNRK